MYERASKSLAWVPFLNDPLRGTTALVRDLAVIFFLGLQFIRGATFAFLGRAADSLVALTAVFLGLRFADVFVVNAAPHAFVSAEMVARRIFCLDRVRIFLKGSYI